MFIESAPMPNEWMLTLLARSDNMIHETSGQRANGYYLIRTEESSIVFENEDSTWRHVLEAQVKKVWHPGSSPSIKLQSIVNQIILQEIHKNSVGKDLKISWHVSGFGFMYEREQQGYTPNLIRIEASSSTSKIYPRRKFVKDILEKVDRFKR